MAKTMVAEGIYCTGCGFFEDDEMPTGENCPSCGCGTDVHHPAEVIAEVDSVDDDDDQRVWDPATGRYVEGDEN